MVYILTGSLVILFFISYFLGGQDFFAPMTIQVMSFIFSGVMCIYYMHSFDAPYKFHWETITIIISCLTLSVGIGIWIHHLLNKINIHSYTQAEIKVSPIPNTISIIILILVILIAIWEALEVRRISGVSGSYAKIAFAYRNLTYRSTTNEYYFPFLLRQLLLAAQAILVLYGFDLIRFRRMFRLNTKLLHVIIIGVCSLIGLLGAGRSTTVNQLIACIIIFHLLRCQEQNGYKKYSFMFLLRIFIVICFLLWAFSALKTFVGRNSSMNNPLDYISYYTGTEFITFDIYLQNPPSPPQVFGQHTFNGLIQNLINLGADIPRYVTRGNFVSVGGGLANNVYTLFRTYHYDFGTIGMYILHITVSVFMSVFYEYIKKKNGNIAILTFGAMYYSIVLTFFAEGFFSTVVNLTFLKRLLLLLVLYEFLIRKRVRFMFGRKSKIF